MSDLIPMTRAGSIMALGRFLTSVGAPFERYAEKAGIPVHLLGDPANCIPLLAAYRLVEIATRKEHIDNVSYYAAKHTSIYDMGPYGCQLLQALTIREYLQIGVNALSLNTTGERFWIEDIGQSIRLYHAMEHGSSVSRSQVPLFGIGLTIKNCQLALGSDWWPAEIGLPMDASVRRLHQIIPGARIERIPRYSYITFSKATAAKPFRSALPRELLSQAYQDHFAGPLPGDLQSSLNAIVEMALPYGYPDLVLAADYAGVSPRTLQRMLKVHGTSYRAVVDGYRMNRACDLLEKTDTPIQDIARQLAYTEPANFTRAFRLKTGISPAQYRESYRLNHP